MFVHALRERGARREEKERKVKGDLHGTTLLHATSLQQAFGTNFFV